MNYSNQTIDRTRILTRSEIATVLADLKRKRRSVNTRQNRIIFRLATCTGLRVSEITKLTLANVKTGGKRPHIVVAAKTAKRKRGRKVALWWDAGTLADLEAWKRERVEQGAGPGDPFVCSQNGGKHSQTGEPTRGKPLSVRNAQARFKAAIKSLGAERVRQLSIHSGRHSFCSHALAGGRTIVDVRDAAGHRNISTTSIYLHVVVDEDEEPGSLFDFAAA